MKVRNLTPHPIVILNPDNVEFKTEIRKLITNNPVIVRTIESEGMLSAHNELIKAEPIDGINTMKILLIPSDKEPADDEYYIVSAMYLTSLLTAGKDTSKYLTIGQMVFDEQGKTVLGCLGLVRN